MFLRKSGNILVMNRTAGYILIAALLTGCQYSTPDVKRVAVARVGDEILYRDEIPWVMQPDATAADSNALLQNYINSWARKEFLYFKARENLAPETNASIEKQLQATRENLVIYHYQRQMMLERMDTIVTDKEMESYYATNEKNFFLSSNIVKALYIKVPVDAPNVGRVRMLYRSADQNDLQQLESYCYQFAEKFDDFKEDWVTMDRLSVELPSPIPDEDTFLKYNTWYETRDSLSLYFVTFRDYRLRYSLAPYEYVRNDIKGIILNNRRFEFLQTLENGIYSEGIKANLLKVY